MVHIHAKVSPVNNIIRYLIMKFCERTVKPCDRVEHLVGRSYDCLRLERNQDSVNRITVVGRVGDSPPHIFAFPAPGKLSEDYLRIKIVYLNFTRHKLFVHPNLVHDML